ncbi:hypothetical protein DAPPUDRAFT_240958 [Daphnia pulex]|uniref:Uncharacterized protein n=1 Tax=Daphnia pulex TaxID=6669 RepID=E9GD17_DAPPU|nr:hypothetical protein DAPPUDRAFT_240958 [Daphnia pulex]|eukprot:EFX82768.1 hypothetical protein DAPPUDRAFT_240958 [Daphnia pulex]
MHLGKRVSDTLPLQHWHATGRHEIFKQVEEILIIDLILPILMKLILILSWPNGVTRIRIVKKLTCDETFDQLV